LRSNPLAAPRLRLRLSASQSWTDPGAAAGAEDGRTGPVAGAGVAGAASDGAGMLDAVLGGCPDLTAGILDTALGGDSDFMEGVSRGLSSLCGGLSRGIGGLPGGG
jgi:hypothetical protein